MKSAAKKSRGIYAQIFLIVVLTVFVVVPLITLFTKLDGKTISSVFHGAQFWPALRNSLVTTTLSTLISVFIAYCLAWAISRTNIKCKGLFSILLVLPMLIPSISHGMGLTILFGNNGIVTRMFNTTSNIYGHLGIILGSVMYSFPVAFLMFVDILKYEDSSVYDAAEVLGIPKHRQFLSITLPYMRKALISVLFTVFTLIITDYGVPLAVGGQVKTLAVLLFEYAVGQLNYSVGALIGLFLLVPAVIAFLFDLFNKDKAKSGYSSKEFKAKKNTAWDVVAYIVCIAVSAFVLFTISAFCVQAFAKAYPSDLSFTFAHFKNTFSKNGGEYLYNSIMLSLLTACVGMTITFITAYCTSRLKNKLSKLLHIISLVSLSIPGLVLGLSYVIVFKGSFIYGTIAILVFVNTIHFFASPYLMQYNALNKINENLEPVGQVLNVPRIRIITDCIVPQCKSTLVEAFSYFFVNSMMTISAVSFLATRLNKPLSLMINQFEAFGMLECAAVVALLILTVNIIMKSIFYFIKRRRKNDDNQKTI